MPADHASIIICGAGYSGLSAAYQLAVRHRIDNVVIVDERPPLSLTSNKGTEAYRNWWPGPDDTMVRFMNRSIDLLEELAAASDNLFRLSRRGYLFLTAVPQTLEAMAESAAIISRRGAGTLRRHPGPIPYWPGPVDGYAGAPDGADLLLEPGVIREHFPYVTPAAVGGLHVRRAGWFDSGALGRWLLAQAEAHGARLRRDRLAGVDVAGDRVQAVRLAGGDRIATETLVIAAGPYLPDVAALLGLKLPVENELHGKATLLDEAGVIPADAPLLIWNDPVTLAWSDVERAALAADPAARRLLEPLPAGVHVRPRERDGRSERLIIWTYDVRPGPVVWPPQFAPRYGEVLLRGLARLIPGLSVYFGRGGQLPVDGGYYCKTPENRPLIGPLPVRGAFVLGAMSGFGLMGSQAAAELLAAHVMDASLPDYAPAFHPARYDDPAYLARLASWDPSAGEL